MHRLFKKLRSQKGESLIESLVSILIFTCASIALYSMVTSAADINRIARDADETSQAQMLIAEQGEGESKTGTVTISLGDGESFDIAVDIYGGVDSEGNVNDSLYAYYAQEEGDGT